MNILFFCHLFYPHIGGVEKHVMEINKILIKKGHKVVVVTERHDETLKLKEKINNIEIWRIPKLQENWFKKFKIWMWLFKSQNLMKNADIIHCHDVFFWYLPFRFLYFRKPVFTTFHGYETKNPPARKSIFIRKISEKLSKGNICVGDFIKKWYGTKANYVMYGGVVANIKNQISKINNKSNKLQIVFVGRLEEDNGVGVYIESVKSLKKQGIKFDFFVCGDGAFRKEAEKYGKVLGFTQDVKKYIALADIVFSSSYLSMLEGMIMKRLVFAAYATKVKKDYLKISPFKKYIIIVSSAQSLVGHIINYRNKPKQYDKQLEKAFNWAKENSWDSVVASYLKLWKHE